MTSAKFDPLSRLTEPVAAAAGRICRLPFDPANPFDGASTEDSESVVERMLGRFLPAAGQRAGQSHARPATGPVDWGARRDDRTEVASRVSGYAGSVGADRPRLASGPGLRPEDRPRGAAATEPNRPHATERRWDLTETVDEAEPADGSGFPADAATRLGQGAAGIASVLNASVLRAEAGPRPGPAGGSGDPIRLAASSPGEPGVAGQRNAGWPDLGASARPDPAARTVPVEHTAAGTPSRRPVPAAHPAARPVDDFVRSAERGFPVGVDVPTASAAGLVDDSGWNVGRGFPVGVDVPMASTAGLVDESGRGAESGFPADTGWLLPAGGRIPDEAAAQPSRGRGSPAAASTVDVVVDALVDRLRDELEWEFQRTYGFGER